MLDKIKGALFGLAIGDAMGGTTEFLTREEIRRKYGKVTGIIGGGVWNLAKGETTDDTAMTVAVTKGILKNPESPIELIGEEFLKWYATNPKDIGNIIRAVLSTYGEGSWAVAAEKAHNQYLGGKSAGNGTLMRCLPVALAYRDLDKVETVTREQSKMTHYDSLADEACVIYNRVAYQVLHGAGLKEAIQAEIKGTIYEPALNGQIPTPPPDGFVVNTMHWVLYWLLNCESFLDVVIGAANEGYDTDTVAAIAGGLAGLACGYKELPRGYCDVLLVKSDLEELGLKLYELAK
ncbi:ADP-ribosylglycohydrolase family protein [Neobacillus rhizophilus]|uniref:ADP-ribosylglycohydrolase family protein n=1 Tax=Neobacillus rhizophilus TaxID=2833579 RepID=A0A942YWV2_9BACI|nr:ADP-ribosylglycohydrolase family protein [Neobacillus rhizophilus]MBS4213076.1 ADP-ribosylglycohydrolase family protein [Neobacillus rhizophilus]